MRELGTGVPGGRRPFALVLRTASQQAHPQQIFGVKHGDLGEMAIFMVPLGPEEGGMRYEAIFT